MALNVACATQNTHNEISVHRVWFNIIELMAHHRWHRWFNIKDVNGIAGI